MVSFQNMYLCKMWNENRWNKGSRATLCQLIVVKSVCYAKVGIITIGTWYKALWSPNLIQNHNKKVFHTSFEIHLFLGNVPPLQCITELPDDSNSQKKTNIIFSGQNLIKMYNCTRKWWNTIISPYLSNIPTQELISHT